MATVWIKAAVIDDLDDDVLREEDARFFRDRLGGGAPGAVLFAFVGDDLVGHCYLRLEEAEEPELRERLPGVPLLERLRVFPAFQGRGFARALVRAAEERAQAHGRTRLALGVAAKDTDTERADPDVGSDLPGFYRRLGYGEWEHGLVETYREEKFQDDWVRVPEDCRVFFRNLA